MDAVPRRLRRLCLIGALFLGGLGQVWGGEAQRFVAGIDDLPLAPGLEEAPGAVVFDKPDGRIVEADAGGRVPAAAVRAFYRAVLPAFGWTAARRCASRSSNATARSPCISRLLRGFLNRRG